MPATRLCVQHAHEIAEYGGKFRTVVNEDVTSKHGSLKKTYGRVTTYRRRNTEALDRFRDAYQKVVLKNERAVRLHRRKLYRCGVLK